LDSRSLFATRQDNPFSERGLKGKIVAQPNGGCGACSGKQRRATGAAASVKLFPEASATEQTAVTARFDANRARLGRITERSEVRFDHLPVAAQPQKAGYQNEGAQ